MTSPNLDFNQLLPVSNLTIEMEENLHCPEKPQRHERYYLDDEPVIFQVENHLFKVHKHFLRRESQVFHWMFACPPRADGAEGNNDERPIHLPDVKSKEFECLLDFFYEGMYRDSSKRIPAIWKTHIGAEVSSGPDKKTIQTAPTVTQVVDKDHDKDHEIENLINLLSISTRFDFDQIRQYAIETLEQDMKDQRGMRTLTPIKQICLARAYNIESWLRPAYTKLCERLSPLEADEAEILGLQTCVLMAQARESLLRQTPSQSPSLLPNTFYTHTEPQPSPTIRTVDRIVGDVFFPKDVGAAQAKKSKRRH